MLSQSSQIKCTACGECCSRECKAKVGNLCAVHPSIIGGEDKASGRRSKRCGWSPVRITLDGSTGVACPPVMDVVERLTGERPAVERGPKSGVLFIKDYSNLSWAGLTDFDRLLRMEIRES